MIKIRINNDEPRWDQNQSTYIGRAKHFFVTTNPLNILRSSKEIEDAMDIVTKVSENIVGVSEDELCKAKNIYDSAYHPETGEKMILVGRMSAQVPMNIIITVVNYSNRSGDSPVSPLQLGTSYVLATSGVLVTALGLNSLVKIREGIAITDEKGNRLGSSVVAAKSGISQVIFSRVCMAVPAMGNKSSHPSLWTDLEEKSVLKKYPLIGAPLQVLLCGIILTFATPMCCALFSQKASISISKLEPEFQGGFLEVGPNRLLEINTSRAYKKITKCTNYCLL